MNDLATRTRAAPARSRWRLPKRIASALVTLVVLAALRVTTHVVEAAKKRPVEEQLAEVRRTMPKRDALPFFFRVYIFPIIEKYVADLAGGQVRTQAELRCTIAALAVERHRRAKGALPGSLAELVPAYLRAVPTDPYDGQPLRYRKVADGVVIYDLGSDCTDDQGNLNRQHPGTWGTDIGLQLWDIDLARQPP